MDCNNAPQFRQCDYLKLKTKRQLDTVARLQADCPFGAGAEKQQR